MTGRGRGNNRGGRGGKQFGGRLPNKGNKPDESKKTILDYNYYVGSAKQASDYETTTQFLINHIVKTFEFGNDIGTALTELTPVDTEQWKPTMQFSTSTDETIKQMENEQFKMEFKSKFDAFLKRKQSYDNNQTKAYALLWERCTKGMKNKVEARLDYQSRIRNDPIELLKSIKEHALNYQESRYSMAIIHDAWCTLINTKQKEGESLQDYTKRFRVARDVLESHIGGPIILTKVVTLMKDFDSEDDEKVKKCQQKAFKQYLAYVYLMNADRNKYGSILTGLITQQSLGNDQYPKTIAESNNVLSNHKFDSPTKTGTTRQTEPKGDQKSKEEDEFPLSFAQMEGKCYCCGKAGHKSPACRFRNKPKEEWAINKSQQSHVQTQPSSEASVVSNNTSVATSSHGNQPTAEAGTETPGWAGTHVHCQFYQADEMKDWILLDNQSTTTIFCNKDLVSDIRDVDDSMNLYTNGGVLHTTKKATIPQ